MGKFIFIPQRREKRSTISVEEALSALRWINPSPYVPAKGPACKASYYYRSILIKGRAGFVRSGKKKLEILEKLMEKYQPEGGYAGVAEEILRKTAVIEVSIDEITGKENLG